jgi:predicted transposase YdaD
MALEVLSNLRNFQSIIIKYLETMPIVYNLETDIRYQQGKGKGKEEGIEVGIELGEGNQKLKSIKNLIRSKLLTNQQIAAIEEVAVEFVENIERELNL